MSGLRAQFTAADSLRGGYGPGRDWWDLTHYDLHVTFDEVNREISGWNTATIRLMKGFSLHDQAPVLQIDLQQPLFLDSIQLLNESGLPSTLPGSAAVRVGNACLFNVPMEWLAKNSEYRFSVYYHGKPRTAKTPPWDGGVVWKTDAGGKPWISIACQGLGASVWFPCKDSQQDEPDSVRMHYTVNSRLVCVSNGRFVNREEHGNGTSTFTWEVRNPINNYCMIPYIGDYINMHEHFKGEKGMLELDYWVLRGSAERAEKQFKEVPRTLEALEYWFGPYPFYEDGYKLVEAPYLGMEHQSAVAYGNEYRNGYLGRDLSGTGIGLKWDFIIVHESGHEWFGNNITSKDIADMWIHESFTNYSEVLFTDYWFGNADGSKYCIGLRRNILNDRPVIGPYGVNSEGSGDMYYKGANMLHTIRLLTASDSLFRMMLRGLNERFYHRTVTTQDIERFMSEFLGRDLSKVFDQYLRERFPPELEIIRKRKKVSYRWVSCTDGFNMPVLIDNYGWIYPTQRRQKLSWTKPGKPEVSREMYLRIKESR